MTSIEVAACAMWGFLVGFVGWAACFRVIQPVSDWLLPMRSDTGRGVVRLFVAIFLMIATLLAIAILPVLFTGAAAADPSAVRRDAFGVSFMSSIAGVLVNGLMRRIGGDVDVE